ncbi:nucleolar pre-ribosomal-associated protein 1 isoform X2 [Microcaecilia unicolor]|uniref:Nucleolar pre-ribosomal-associated protein 1 isoform X2 n=1 Tax=Microcaecilia unicolor TaxID=1415580 RepID=A0A6P7XZI0_9AMPH|nr:nucleolar pre-ribosomal-associated protein 1 isoform X2 [Microcaecilia unicolor]
MGKKRQSESPRLDSDPAGKKARTTESEFTGTQFKSLLKESQSAMRGLDIFIATARKLPCSNLYDVVEGYIKISMECAEIFKLLDGEKRPESELLLIFQALEAILLRTASDLSHFSVVGINIVKKLINSHMKLIYTALYSESHRMSRICLNLMSAMVTQGPDAARDIFSHFDFSNKFLPTLVKKRDKQGRPDVRMAYIQFVLSFFIASDNTTIAQLLELKDFVTDIFITGLKEDRISTINLLLSTLETKVVKNKDISKTQKVRFFTAAGLNHIASLYRWDGIVDVSTEEVKGTQDPREAGKVMIRELVHGFLLDLCCSLKHGINFHDPSLGTVGRAGNLVLLRFLVGLKTSTEDELQAELVVKILQCCPDLLSRYFKETQYSFLPRVKTAWLQNVKLLRKIYEGQPEISIAFKTPEFVPLSRLLSMVMVTSVPPVFNKAMFTQGLNLPNKIVKHTVLSLMSSILRRAQKNIDHCLNEEIWQKSAIYAPALMVEFAQKYREALSKLLPDVNQIVATWQSLLKQEKKDHDEEEKKKEEPVLNIEELGEIPEMTGQHGSDDAETILVKTMLLRVLCLYQKVVPHLVAQSNFDFSKLLKGIVSDTGMREEVPPVLQQHILQLALELPATKFSWLKVQDVPEAGKVCREKSIFYLLLKMFVTSNRCQLKMSTKLLIIKILRDSGVFEYTWQELGIWLDHLDKCAEDTKEAAVQFLEKVLTKLVANPYPYTDKAADFVSEASTLQSSLSNQDSDNISVPISHIDDVLDMVDVIVEGSEGLNEELGFALSEDMVQNTFPFSALVPATLEARNKLFVQGGNDQDGVVQYLVAVLTDILYSQRDPLALCLTLQCYDQELSVEHPLLCRLYTFYQLWIPPQAKVAQFNQEAQADTNVPLTEESSFHCVLQSAYMRGAVVLSQKEVEIQLKGAVSRLQIGELPLAVKQVMLYLKTTVGNFSKVKKDLGAAVVDLFLSLLSCLLCRCEEAKSDSPQTPPEDPVKSDLFIDPESTSTDEAARDKVLEDMLSVVLKHPVLESWFLAVERQSLPPHTLNPVGVKLLSSHLNCGILGLLQSAAPSLQRMNRLDLITKYCEAVAESVLKELQSGKRDGEKTFNKTSQAMEALLGLHQHLDTSQLKEVTLALLGLPEESLTTEKPKKDSTRGTHLSPYGKALVHILSESHRRSAQREDLCFSIEHIRGLGTLLCSSSSQELEEALWYMIQKEPMYVQVLGLDILTHCLSHKTETSLSIGALLIQHSRTQLLQFELWCLSDGMRKLLEKHMDTYLPLISTYLQCREQEDFTRPSKVSTAVTMTLRTALWKKLVNTALADEDSSGLALQMDVLSKLLPFSDTGEVIKLSNQLLRVLSKMGSQERWLVADSIRRVMEPLAKETYTWKKSLLSACLTWLIATFSSNEQEETDASEKAMLARLEELLRFDPVPAEWSSFVKTGLKYRYRDCAFLGTLNTAINMLYGKEASDSLLQLSVIHMMITQHSLFLPTMLRSRDEAISSPVREALVDVLTTLVRKCPSVCHANHFAVLLGAYGATLSITDQKILLLLQLYEKNDISLTDFRLLLWGPAAVEHHKTRKSLGKSLWQQPSMEEILCLLDRERMMKTIMHFPLHRRLHTEEGHQNLYEDDSISELDALYDPSFLIPLFSELFRPEFVVDCLKFVDINALGLSIAALSSYDSRMRAAANYVLGSFYSHLEGARFRDKKSLLYLMDVVKSGIKKQNLQLTFSLTLYIAKVAKQILRPEEHMYMKISRFLLSHQSLDMNKLPDFYRLFYSFDLEHKEEREWVLTLLAEGLRDRRCYELYDYQKIFHVILSFFSSSLCDEHSQNQILDILHRAAPITKAAYGLIRDHSLLTWILSLLDKRCLESQRLASIISLTHKLWVTNLGKKDTQVILAIPGKDGLPENPKFLPLQLINEFLFVLLKLIQHIWSCVSFLQLNEFFITLNSVLGYRTLVMKAFKEMGRFTVNEKVFSSKAVLMLLHKWSLVEKDVGLQDWLHTVAEKYSLKDLLKTIKEKNKPPSSQQSRRRIVVEGEEELDSKMKVTYLENCRDLLASILLHWEPMRPPAEPYETADSENKGDTLECAAASLVAKWVLKSATKHDLTIPRICAVLQWFHVNVLPNGAVVETLLKDHTLRNCIFKLYSRVCKSGTLDSDVLHLFNTIMIELLNIEGCSETSRHKLVKEMCLRAADDNNRSRKAALIFLVSVYIVDKWLGPQKLDMFTDHVQMVCRTANEILNCDKEKPGRQRMEAIVSLCEDISAALLEETKVSAPYPEPAKGVTD